MDAKTRRKMAREQMAKRQEESYNKKDDSGRFKSIFNEKLPSDKRFKSPEGDHSLDIIPFIAGKNNPNTKPGNFAYILDLFVHYKIGVNEDSYVCLSKTYNKPCPICEYQADLRKQDEYDEDVVKSLNAKRRGIYNVWCHDTPKEEAKGLQVWDVSHYLFESNLIEMSKKKKGGGYILFSDPDEGKIVSFRRTGQANATKFVAITFEDREGPITDDMLDKAYCLDDLIHIPEYAEVETAFFGKVKEEEKELEQPKEDKKKRTKEPEPEPEPEKEEDIPEELGEPVCPSDYVFGADFGDYDECDECEVRKDCRTKKREGKEEKKEEPKEEKKEEPKEDAGPRRRRR